MTKNNYWIQWEKTTIDHNESDPGVEKHENETEITAFYYFYPSKNAHTRRLIYSF